MRRSFLSLIVFFVFAPFLVACGDDDTDVGEEITETTDEAAARAAAEGLRTSLAGNDTAAEEGLRSITAINEAIDSVPGDPEFTGVEDTTGDGFIDDGDIEVMVGDSYACVSIPEDDPAEDEDNGVGETVDRAGEIDVSGGRC
jgi:hypothetical protein